MQLPPLPNLSQYIQLVLVVAWYTVYFIYLWVINEGNIERSRVSKCEYFQCRRIWQNKWCTNIMKCKNTYTASYYLKIVYTVHMHGYIKSFINTYMSCFNYIATAWVTCICCLKVYVFFRTIIWSLHYVHSVAFWWMHVEIVYHTTIVYKAVYSKLYTRLNKMSCQN